MQPALDHAGRIEELVGGRGKATSVIVPASGSMDTSSQPRRTAEGGGGTRPSIASQNGPSRVTYLFYQSIPVLRDLLHRESRRRRI